MSAEKAAAEAKKAEGARLHCTTDTQPTKFHGQSCLGPGTFVVNKADVEDVANDEF